MNYSIEKVTTPRGDVRYELRMWDRGRKSKQIKRRFKARKDAQAMIDKRQREERESVKPAEERLTFGEVYALWREERDGDFAPGWKANLNGYWDEARVFLEGAKLNQLKPKLKELKAFWVDEGLSTKTINNKMGFIHAVLNHSVEKERLTFNPLGKYRKPKVQEPDIEFWERHEAESFLSFMNERYPVGHPERFRYSACFTVLNTAIRAGELWGLKARDLKPSLSSIRIVRQFNRVSKKFEQLKGKKARSVPYNSELQREIELWVRDLDFADLIFSRAGKPVDHDAFHDLFDEDVRAWGGKRITFHGLRHTAATLMLLSGVDVKSLQEIMGHEDISTTMRYVHALGESAKKAAETFSVKAKDNVLRLADFG